MATCSIWLLLGHFGEKRIIVPKTKHERSENTNNIITIS